MESSIGNEKPELISESMQVSEIKKEIAKKKKSDGRRHERAGTDRKRKRNILNRKP